MGEWSDYFEDFPEENPANWVNGHYDPEAKEKLKQQEKLKLKENPELHKLINNAKKETKAKSLLVTGNCPQCGLKELNIYKISKNFYLCECQECGIYGNGMTQEKALEKTELALGEGLDWREKSLY